MRALTRICTNWATVQGSAALLCVTGTTKAHVRISSTNTADKLLTPQATKSQLCRTPSIETTVSARTKALTFPC